MQRRNLVNKRPLNEAVDWLIYLLIALIITAVCGLGGHKVNQNDTEAEIESDNKTDSINNVVNPETGTIIKNESRRRGKTLNEELVLLFGLTLVQWIGIYLMLAVIVFSISYFSDESALEAKRNQTKKRKETPSDANADMISKNFPTLKFGMNATQLYFNFKGVGSDTIYQAVFQIGNLSSERYLDDLFGAISRSKIDETPEFGMQFHATSTYDDELIFTDKTLKKGTENIKGFNLQPPMIRKGRTQ